jgi:hypothetical protein
LGPFAKISSCFLGVEGCRAKVASSFLFLLEHEPNTSILPSFDLPVIGRYFPEYERQIHTQLRQNT